jgi:hypothetical protein
LTFNAAQCQAMADRLDSGLTKLSGKLNEIGPTVQSGTYHWYITDKIAEAVRWVGDKLMELGSWVLEKLKELAKGIAAPVTFWFTAHDWQDQVKGKASMVAGATGVKALRAPLV